MSLELKIIIEGLLFVAETPLSVARMVDVIGEAATPARAREALDELAEEYADAGRAFILAQVAGGYQFRTRPELSGYILNLKKKAATRLSRAAMETLAVIAYRQPILRVEIERIRGVDAGGVLRTLMERDLVRVVGRKDLPGRPMLYGTTARFLETFGLPGLEALPSLEEMEALGPDPDVGRLF